MKNLVDAFLFLKDFCIKCIHFVQIFKYFQQKNIAIEKYWVYNENTKEGDVYVKVS